MKTARYIDQFIAEDDTPAADKIAANPPVADKAAAVTATAISAALAKSAQGMSGMKVRPFGANAMSQGFYIEGDSGSFSVTVKNYRSSTKNWFKHNCADTSGRYRPRRIADCPRARSLRYYARKKKARDVLESF